MLRLAVYSREQTLRRPDRKKKLVETKISYIWHSLYVISLTELKQVFFFIIEVSLMVVA